MSDINVSATVTSDIDFFQSETSTYSSAFRNLQGSIGYKVGITGGSGAGWSQADAVYSLAGYVIASGANREYDFKSLSQDAVGSSYVVSMTGLKALVIRNHNTGTNEVLRLQKIVNEGKYAKETISPSSTKIKLKMRLDKIYKDREKAIKKLERRLK